MKLYEIIHSQNGREYTGRYLVKCKHSCEQRDRTLIIDNEIEIEFDEDFEVEFAKKVEK